MMDSLDVVFVKDEVLEHLDTSCSDPKIALFIEKQLTD